MQGDVFRFWVKGSMFLPRFLISRVQQRQTQRTLNLKPLKPYALNLKLLNPRQFRHLIQKILCLNEDYNRDPHIGAFKDVRV